MAKDSSQIPPSSSTSRRRVIYDVFISFRGADTRLGFADHIYSALKRKGLIVFRDEEKLERGESISEELTRAIQESENAVIIISKNFIFSKWCLIELTEILKCKKEKSLKVLPVFYHVEPRDVRKPMGSLATAFLKHWEDKVDEQKMKTWRDALKEVGQLAGWDVHGRYESIVIEEICIKIFDGLSRQISRSIEDLVGIDSQIEELMTLLCINGDNVRFIGICGMGGIGKTTLAEVIYSRVFSRFEASCFISNVREESQKSGSLLSLQKELIFQIFGVKEPKICNTFQGRNMIASRAENKRVFIVLDDVDKENQLEELVGKYNWFGKGSRVLITSRDRDLLKKHVDEINDVKKLTHDDALQLFNLKAFKQRYYEGNHAQYREEILKHAGGLPLALKVFGSFLFGRRLDAWESALDRLKADPDSNILDRLQLSFEGLGKIQKQLFLDIACFFKGKLVDNVIYKLEALGHFPKIDIPILESKSLITISKDNILEMHDLLQEMGQQIVYRESSREPGERSRLWNYKDIIHVLKNNTGTNAIESIVLELPLPKLVKLSFEGFSRMTKLRMLVICPIYEAGAHKNWEWYEEAMLEQYKHPSNFMLEWYGSPSKLMLSSELHILEWWGFPLDYVPSICDLDNLISLKMPMGYVKQLLDVRKTFDKLKYVDVRNLQNGMEMLNFSNVPSLEVFLARGTTLRPLQSSIALPKKPSVKCIVGKPELPSLSLPSSISQSSLLVKLNLSYCNMVDGVLPCNLDCLSSLKCLYLTGNKFTRLPDSISQLSNLWILQLDHCTRLQKLPSKLPLSLGYLNLDFCPLKDTLHNSTDASTSSVKLLTGDSSIVGFYFGFEDTPHGSLHLLPSSTHPGFIQRPRNIIAWGPTLESEIPASFTQISTTSFGTNQCRMTLDLRAALSLQGAETLLDINMFWGLALFIVYEVREADDCERKGKAEKFIEHGNNSSCPVFVCEVEYKVDGSRFRIVFCVPEVLPFRPNGVWVTIRDLRVYSNMRFKYWIMDEGEEIKVSIKTRNLNVVVKECGARIIIKNNCKDFFEVLSRMSPHVLHLSDPTSPFMDVELPLCVTPVTRSY